MKINYALLSGAVCVLLTTVAHAQTPRISSLFPAGGKAGETVSVEVKGGNLLGAKSVVVSGAPGVTGTLEGGAASVDQSAKPLFQAKCTSCHEARSPANRSMNAEQWAQTVDRMISARGADINKADRDTVVGYLQALAKAGQITAKLTIAPDAAPGFREVRLLTDTGISTSYRFEVGTIPEIAAQPDTKREAPQKLTLPIVINGTLATGGKRDWFSFDAKKGDRLTFNLKGFRINEKSQAFFNPTVYLYDASGREVGKNLGRMGLDPALEWTAPETGTYTLLVRDLVWRGSPASVYRLAVGTLPIDGILAPSVARPGSVVSARMVGMAGATSDSGSVAPFTVSTPDGTSGVTMVTTPLGESPLLVRDLPDGGGPVATDSKNVVALPAVFRGLIASPGHTDTFRVKSAQPGTALEVYARRLGSPLRAQVTIRNSKGEKVREQTANGSGDVRVNAAFAQPGEYTVEITDADGNGGGAFVYSWEALDGTPDFTMTATPDGANLLSGGRIPLTVRLTKRENVSAPIAITVTGLPEGVTASTATILPEDDKAIVVLTASPTAQLTGATVRVLGTTETADGKTVARRARPLEITRINNNPRPFPRTTQFVAVGSDPAPFTVELVGEPKITLTANEEAKVTVKITRHATFKGEVSISFIGTPPGVGVQNVAQIPADKTEATLTIRANRDAPLYRDGAKPMFIVIAGMTGSSEGDPVACTLPIPLVPVLPAK